MSVIDTAAQVDEVVSTYKELMDKVNIVSNPLDENSDIKRGNANINGLSVQGKLQQIANETSKIYALKYLVSPKFAKAHKNGDIHIHDLDYYLTKTTTCTQIDLGELLRNGIWNEHGYIRPPKTIQVAGYLAAVILQSHQNQQHGGQSFANFDFDMAPYVRLSYEKNKKKIAKYNPALNEEELDKLAWEQTEEDTHQAMEGFVHNINTMHSRGGGQVVFASVNFGMDTSREGRLVSKCLMQAQSEGLGKGETPIFPILIVKVKEGINYNPEDPNYDLFKMSMEVTAKRLFPNWIFEDAPYNADYGDDPKDACATMGCRTRLFNDVFGKNTSVKRGNASFTSINLPRLAIEADHDIDKFFTLLDDRLQLVHDQLYERFEYQCTAIPDEFKYMAENNTQFEDFKKTGQIRDAIRHSSLSIGFIGLAETLIALIGKHHGESEEAQELGLRIVKHMRDFCDKKKDEEHLNWSLLATPAEGLAERFVKIDKEKYGVIEGVTDKDYYTNSSHVPVYYPISAFDKIDIEAPYHALENAGHIAYIELDGDPSNNIAALESVVRHMHDMGIGYGAINHPVDKCRDCGYKGAGIEECPVCGSKNIERLRRITGYLVGTLERWNNGKKAEEHDRVKHTTPYNENGVYTANEKAQIEALKREEAEQRNM